VKGRGGKRREGKGRGIELCGPPSEGCKEPLVYLFIYLFGYSYFHFIYLVVYL
jgi:hypothetical protein